MPSRLNPAVAEALYGRLGKDFADRYELTDVLGAGGMAKVYRAKDKTLGRAVAVKVQAHDAEAPEFNLERFRYEAMAGASIRDPHVVQVYEFGVGTGCWWMAAELVEGKSLADRLEASGPLGPADALLVAVDVARGLLAIHARNLVHRDVKPENVLHSEVEGRYKVSDLGLAKGEGRTFQTGVGLFLGTPRYMAPEQVLGKAGPPADWHAVGTLLFHMLTGGYPYTAEQDMDIVLAKAKLPGPERRASELVPAVPAALDELIASLLAKDPAVRPVGAALLARLESLLERTRQGTLATAGRSRSRAGSHRGSNATRVSEATPALAAGRRRAPFFAAVFGVGLLAVPLALLLRPGPPPAPIPIDTPDTGDALRLPADPAKGAEARQRRERRIAAMVATLEKGGLGPAGDPAEDNDAARFLNLSRPLPPDVTVDLDLLIARLGPMFEGDGPGWDALAAYLGDEQVPLEQRLTLYRGLARWSAGALAIGVDPRGKTLPPPRPAHRLLAVMGALVPITREIPPPELSFGPASSVLGLTNAYNFNEFVVGAVTGNARSPQAQFVGQQLSEMTQSLRALVKDSAVRDRLQLENWTARRLLGKKVVEIVPGRVDPALPPTGRLVLKIAVADLYVTAGLRLTVPISGGAPLDVLLTQPDLRHSSISCRVPGCNPWRHHAVFTIGLPRGVGLSGTGAVGLRMGPLRPSGPRATIILTEYARKDGELADVREAMRASGVVTGAWWIRQP